MVDKNKDGTLPSPVSVKENPDRKKRERWKTERKAKNAVWTRLLCFFAWQDEKLRNVCFSENFAYVLNEWSTLEMDYLSHQKQSPAETPTKDVLFNRIEHEYVCYEGVCERIWRLAYFLTLNSILFCFFLAHNNNISEMVLTF